MHITQIKLGFTKNVVINMETIVRTPRKKKKALKKEWFRAEKNTKYIRITSYYKLTNENKIYSYGIGFLKL